MLLALLVLIDISIISSSIISNTYWKPPFCTWQIVGIILPIYCWENSIFKIKGLSQDFPTRKWQREVKANARDWIFSATLLSLCEFFSNFSVLYIRII